MKVFDSFLNFFLQNADLKRLRLHCRDKNGWVLKLKLRQKDVSDLRMTNQVYPCIINGHIM